jgi:hypothetical protein
LAIADEEEKKKYSHKIILYYTFFKACLYKI